MENICIQIFEHTLEEHGSEIKTQIEYTVFVCPRELGVGLSEAGMAYFLSLVQEGQMQHKHLQSRTLGAPVEGVKGER